MRGRRLAAAAAVTVLAAACAIRTAPPLPTALKYPEFIYPAVPRELAAARQAARVDAGWRFLQNDDLPGAEREFVAALKSSPGLYPARAGSAYVALAREELTEALAAFDAVVQVAPAYVPALVGRGQTLLALQREADALKAFEAAVAVDPSLADVHRRVDVLRFRGLQEVIEAARAAAAAGRLDEADRAYERALAASPESGFLYRERGQVARRRGDANAALTHFRRAADLEPADAASLVQIGELLEMRQDFAGADAAYRRAAGVEPTAELEARIAAMAERAREARLPAEFRAIEGTAQITRGDLAALIGVRLEGAVRDAPAREVVMTDVGGHWAAPWITEVARAGVMEPFANHTFQPRGRVTRADLAGAVSRLVALLAVRRPELRPHLTAKPPIADMPSGHLSYPAAAVAVASGVMTLADGDRFETARPVSGPEAAEVVGRVRALAAR
ncbi:MAG: S-layer homology domain-containing protein [Acidobacteria bacterium]|nr:S-layer homology domain-containing protein [Acidobacteriota bacterium]